jgi:four helix bundle protein
LKIDNEKWKIMKENIIVDKSFKFAVRVVKLYKYLCDNKKEYTLSKQLLRSGTSIGANISEATQGQSKRDFPMKMNIALKETSETKYWLRLFKAAGILSDNEQSSILRDCIELEKLLTSIVKTTSSRTK